MEIIVQFLEYHRFSAKLLSQIVLDGKKNQIPNTLGIDNILT